MQTPGSKACFDRGLLTQPLLMAFSRLNVFLANSQLKIPELIFNRIFIVA